MDKRFEGKTIIVTGAGSGIGKSAALAFAAQGGCVLVSDIDQKQGEQTVKEINRAPKGSNEAVFIRCDVSKPAEVEEMVGRAVSEYGGLDCAFNNAGIEGQQALTADYSVEMWNKVIAVNLTGVWLCMKFELAEMMKRNKGSIVNNASILGTVGFAGASAYVTAKHGVLGLTKTAALEYATKGIRINAVCPGFIETPILQRGGILTDPNVRSHIAGLHAMKRLGTPEEISSGVLWLCSDEASFVSGHALLMDGGYVAQ